MPSIAHYLGYSIYFWSNESGEPVHVHVTKGNPSKSATKIWLTQSGGAVVANNSSRIGKKDLSLILDYITANYFYILQRWILYFGIYTFYC